MKKEIIDKEEYCKACKEVLEILKSIKEEELEKIPKSEIEILRKNACKDYEFSYDVTKNIKEQNVSKVAKAIIGNFFIDYIATAEQKQIMMDKQNYDKNIIRKARLKELEYTGNIAEGKKVSFTENVLEEKRGINTSNKLPLEIKKVNFVSKINLNIKRFINNLLNIKSFKNLKKETNKKLL